MTPDAAPEAITQADREARDAWFAGDRDPRSIAEAFARHRRLTAHSAGEGLREALIRVARMIPGVLCADGVSDAFLAHIPDELAHYTITRTPPSDAGSTTCSGEEGVWPDIGGDPLKGPRPDDRHEAAYEAVRAAYVKQQSGVPDQTALVWRWHLGALLERHVRLRAILAREATTPSPDASPDSGKRVSSFEREDRYIVFKKDHLSGEQLQKLEALTTTGPRGNPSSSHDFPLPTVECVVVEADWPEYDPVWAMIQQRVDTDNG